MDWLAGIAGFLLLEGLKVYRRVWGAGKALPERHILWGMSVLWLAALSGIVAHILADGDAVKALFVGFSVPMGLKGIVVRPRLDGDDLIDDVEIGDNKGGNPSILKTVISLVEDSLRTV